MNIAQAITFGLNALVLALCIRAWMLNRERHEFMRDVIKKLREAHVLLHKSAEDLETNGCDKATVHAIRKYFDSLNDIC